MFEVVLLIVAIVVLNILYKMGSALFHHKRVYKAPRSTILYDVLAVVSFLFGIAVLYFSIIVNINSLKITEWSPNPCTIEKIDYKILRGRSKGAKVYPQYRYEYNRKSYIGTRYRSVDVPISWYDHDAIDSKFTVGREAVCYVDPNNPEQSVLESAMDGDVVRLILLYYGISLFCFFPVICILKKRRDSRKASLILND